MDVQTRCQEFLDEVERAVVGKRDVLELLLVAFLANGHVLIEDLPGLGKTLMARSFATVAGLDFSRLQFTPDLMPMDVTGSTVMDPNTTDFEFRPGPVFTNLLLADEVNRAPAKTQAALLEAMQERQVTVDGESHRLDAPFLVVATQNPIEFEGTYPLPEAQLDRFIVRLEVGYPDRPHEEEILRARLGRESDDVVLRQVLASGELSRMQAAVESVHVDDGIVSYITELVNETRDPQRVQVGSSPRGALALMALARAKAVVAGRDFVLPEDVKALAVPALAHRLVLRPEMWVREVSGGDIVRACLDRVPVPPTVPPGG
ncbi:MAG: MoxR family ATPase [Acidimicrobiia bacterium]|jgi:MoxR-like ATPase|nr:MAG: MoxR family ATPase [Acidimicrobiia bacterium]